MGITEPIEIPEDLKAFVQSQIDAGHFRDAAEYIRQLISTDLERCQWMERYASDVRIGDLLLAELRSGESRPVDLEALRDELSGVGLKS